MTARDDYPIHGSMTPVGTAGQECEAMLNEIDRLRALVTIRRRVEGDISCVPPPCPDD